MFGAIEPDSPATNELDLNDEQRQRYSGIQVSMIHSSIHTRFVNDAAHAQPVLYKFSSSLQTRRENIAFACVRNLNTIL